MYKISRYWNRFAFGLVYLGFWLVWDYTKRNKDLLSDEVSGLRYVKDILTLI